MRKEKETRKGKSTDMREESSKDEPTTKGNRNGNSVLNTARRSSDTDEWYTPYELVEEELARYEIEFTGKSVLCNCDDPFESNFSKYFVRNFNRLKLRKLTCASYANSKIDSLVGYERVELTDENGEPVSPNSGYVMTIEEIPNRGDDEIPNDDVLETIRKNGTIRRLRGNGDFRSEECVELLKECDVCCTNPPFSLFAELFSLLVRYDKKYLLVGNQNAITYKEVFPYVKEGKAWVGYRFGDMAFRVPNDSPPRKTRFWVDETGQKWRSLGNAMWLTNLDAPKRNVPPEPTKRYSPAVYERFDGQDAINVPSVAEIPRNYDGVMGVPITFLKRHDDVRFEIVGEANHGSDNEFDLFKPKLNGKETFKRILIRRRPRPTDDPNEFRILDLFCGAGGFSYGMERNPKFRTVVAVDFDERAANTFKTNMPATEVMVGDLTDSETKRKVVEAARKAGANVVVGGPPCQGFSSKGKKLGLDDPRNFLFREYLNVVAELKPEVFVIENVRNLLSTANGWFRDRIVEEVERLGYEIDCGILNARDFGVPQSRERAFFVCSRIGKISLPIGTTTTPTTVREAIGDLAYLESGEGEFETEYRTEATTKYQKERRGRSRKLYDHEASNHSPVALWKLGMIPPEKGKECLPPEALGRQKFRSTWGRLKWDEPSPTIDTRFDAASNGTNNHPTLNRSITPREAARLQSFDDEFVFYGPRTSVRRQIGNAVPPLLAEAIANRIAEAVEEIRNRPNGSND